MYFVKLYLYVRNFFFYLTALICNFLKMQKSSWPSHSEVSQLSASYVDPYNVYLLNHFVEGPATFVKMLQGNELADIASLFFSLDEFLCFTL